MYTVELSDTKFKLEAKGDLSVFPSEARKVLEDFIRNLFIFHTKTSLSEFVYEKVGGIYTYTADTLDGRIWNQNLEFDIVNHPGDPAMAFSVSGNWRLSEFILHRAIRENLIVLTELYALTKLEVKFF